MYWFSTSGAPSGKNYFRSNLTIRKTVNNLKMVRDTQKGSTKSKEKLMLHCGPMIPKILPHATCMRSKLFWVTFQTNIHKSSSHFRSARDKWKILTEHQNETYTTSSIDDLRPILRRHFSGRCNSCCESWLLITFKKLKRNCKNQRLKRTV